MRTPSKWERGSGATSWPRRRARSAAGNTMLPPCVTTKAVVPSCRRRAIDSHVASCCRAKRRACSLPPMSSRTSCRERIVSYCCCVRASSGEPARSSLVSSTCPAISTAVSRARSRGLLMTRANSPALRRRRRAAAIAAAVMNRGSANSLASEATAGNRTRDGGFLQTFAARWLGSELGSDGRACGLRTPIFLSRRADSNCRPAVYECARYGTSASQDVVSLPNPCPAAPGRPRTCPASVVKTVVSFPMLVPSRGRPFRTRRRSGLRFLGHDRRKDLGREVDAPTLLAGCLAEEACGEQRVDGVLCGDL